MGYLPYGLTGPLNGQNQVNTQSANVRPNMPGYAGIDKLPFDMMRTPEDQIHWLYLFAKQAENLHITKAEAQELIDAACAAFKEWVEEDQKRQDDDVAEKYDYLLKLIYELVGFNGMVYDPTEGKQDGVRRVAEHIYDFDRVFAVTALDFDTKYAWTAGKYDSENIVARDYDVAFVAYNYLDKLGYATQDANSNWFMQRLRATMGDMGFLNFDSPLDNEGGTVRLTLGENSPLNIDNGALQLKAVSPVKADRDGVALGFNEPLYDNAGKLDLQVEKPISTDGGAVSLSHGDTLKVVDGLLDVDGDKVVNVIAPLVVSAPPTNSSPYAVVIGHDANSTDEYTRAVVIGYMSNVGANKGNPVAIGYSAYAKGLSAVCIGENGNAEGEYSVSIGSNTTCDPNSSVAIGYGSRARSENEFAVGDAKAPYDPFTRRITSVTDPTDPTDAATKQYVDALRAEFEAFKETCVTEGVAPLYKED